MAIALHVPTAALQPQAAHLAVHVFRGGPPQKIKAHAMVVTQVRSLPPAQHCAARVQQAADQMTIKLFANSAPLGATALKVAQSGRRVAQRTLATRAARDFLYVPTRRMNCQ